jgi:hypothetical protein
MTRPLLLNKDIVNQHKNTPLAYPAAARLRLKFQLIHWAIKANKVSESERDKVKLNMIKSWSYDKNPVLLETQLPDNVAEADVKQLHPERLTVGVCSGSEVPRPIMVRQSLMVTCFRVSDGLHTINKEFWMGI